MVLLLAVPSPVNLPQDSQTLFAKIIGSTELSGGAGAGADRYAYQFEEVTQQ